MAEPKLFVVASAGTHVALDITAFNDTALSYKAMGIHAYIRTRQVGEMISMPDIMLATRDGDHAVRTGVKELLLANYLHLVKLRDGHGRIVSVIYVSMPVPVDIEATALANMVSTGKLTLPLGDFPQVDNREVVDAQLGRSAELSTTFGSNKPEDLIHNISTTPKGVAVNYELSTVCKPNGAPSQPEPNKQIDKMLTLWNNQPNLPTHRRGLQYKTYTAIVQHLTKALRKHSPMVISAAIETYAWFRDQPSTVANGTGPPSLVGLNEFFAFKPYSQALIGKAGHPLRGMDCWFRECKRGKDYLLAAYGKIRKDANPMYTEAIAQAVRNCPAFDVGWDTLTPRDLNTLAKASTLLLAWMDAHKDSLPKRDTVSMCINRLLMMLSNLGRPLHLGYLVTDITWADFSRYMVTMGAIDPPRRDTRELARHGTTKGTHQSGAGK